MRYLAGAYQAAGGSQSRAVSLYASGYHGRGVRLARAPRTMKPQQAWEQSQLWDRDAQQSPQWQSTQVAMRGDAMTVRGDAMIEAAPRTRVRHRHRR